MFLAIGCHLSVLFPLAGLARECQQPLTLERIPAAMNGLVELTFAPGDDAGRVFVVRKDGMIFLVEDDAWPSSPFLDIRHKVASPASQGLLGAAFHPSYEQNGYFYVNYTESGGGNTVIERYNVDPANRNLALPGSGLRIIEIAQPDPLHNGGWMEFGPDGYLYVAMGDGGPVGDPAQRAQDGGELLGKILRLDVDHPSPGLEYGIPPSNPFVQDPAVRDEIWALGLRNPWRCDFDSATGDLWITDVGNARWEEIDLQPAGQGGSNYGWSIVEGSQCFNPPTNCNTAGLWSPLHEYDHGGSPYRCSIIGGVLYRGSQMADMHGRFFFADYCSDQTWSLRVQGGQVQDLVEHTAELTTPSGGSLGAIVALGEDADGEIYVLQGPAFELCRIVPAGLRMRLPRLVAGASVAVPIAGGTPHATTGLFYSLTGLGVTFFPSGGVTLGMAQAKLIATVVTDGGGAGLFNGTIPARLLDRTIWLQAAQRGEVSNVGVRTVR